MGTTARITDGEIVKYLTTTPPSASKPVRDQVDGFFREVDPSGTLDYDCSLGLISEEKKQIISDVIERFEF